MFTHVDAADSNAEYAFVSGELADNITTTISQYEGSGLDDLQLQNCRGGSSKKGTSKCLSLMNCVPIIKVPLKRTV